MTTMFSALFGGNDAAKAAEQAQAQAAQQRSVDQARQLQTLNDSTAQTALVRRNPRGRRLFADAANASLPSTVA